MIRTYVRTYIHPHAGHIQYISSIIKDHPELCRQELGPRALLDVVRHHYLPGLVVAAETGQVRITLEEAVSIRAGLLSCESAVDVCTL